MWFWILMVISIDVVLSQSVVQIMQSPENRTVYLGQPAALKCVILIPAAPTSLSIIFQHGADIISEKCEAYKKNLYELVCEPESGSGRQTYTLKIKSVSWQDRGRWLCALAGHVSGLDLDVYAPPDMLPISVYGTKILSSSQSSASSSSSSGTASGRDAALAGRPSDPLASSSQSLVSVLRDGEIPLTYGLGTRTNPYDLRSGLQLHLTCATGCGYPRADLTWTAANRTDTQTRKLPADSIINAAPCYGSAATKNMTTTRSELVVHCASPPLVGLNRLECTATGDYEAAGLTKHVFVLCPGGEKELLLTGGEMIGIAVGSCIVLGFLISGCVLLRRRSKETVVTPSGFARGQMV
ncbi:hypothetical protein SprV_0200635300 [Sparganum proliferum]